MKITKDYLRNIIKEELGRIDEAGYYQLTGSAGSESLKEKEIKLTNGKTVKITGEFFDPSTGEGSLTIGNKSVKFYLTDTLSARENAVKIVTQVAPEISEKLLPLLQNKYGNKGQYIK